jgi:hypothetical protein
MVRALQSPQPPICSTPNQNPFSSNLKTPKIRRFVWQNLLALIPNHLQLKKKDPGWIPGKFTFDL